jgi:hypothetical protein
MSFADLSWKTHPNALEERPSVVLFTFVRIK